MAEEIGRYQLGIDIVSRWISKVVGKPRQVGQTLSRDLRKAIGEQNKLRDTIKGTEKVSTAFWKGYPEWVSKSNHALGQFKREWKATAKTGKDNLKSMEISWKDYIEGRVNVAKKGSGKEKRILVAQGKVVKAVEKENIKVINERIVVLLKAGRISEITSRKNAAIKKKETNAIKLYSKAEEKYYKNQATQQKKLQQAHYRSRLELDRVASSMRRMAILAIAAFTTMVRESITFGIEMLRMVAVTGLAVEKVAKLSAVAEGFGVPANTFIKSVGGLSQALLTAGEGTSLVAARVREVLKTAGLQAERFKGQHRPVIEILDKVKKAYQALKSPVDKAYFAQRAFGENAESMMPFLMASDEAIKRLTKDIGMMPLATEESIQKMVDFNVGLNAIRLTFRNIGIQITESLMPAFDKFKESFQGFSFFLKGLGKEGIKVFSGISGGITAVMLAGGFLLPIVTNIGRVFAMMGITTSKMLESTTFGIKKLGIALTAMHGHIGLIIIAIGAVVTAFAMWYYRAKQMRGMLADLDDRAQKLRKAFEDIDVGELSPNAKKWLKWAHLLRKQQMEYRLELDELAKTWRAKLDPRVMIPMIEMIQELQKQIDEAIAKTQEVAIAEKIASDEAIKNELKYQQIHDESLHQQIFRWRTMLQTSKRIGENEKEIFWVKGDQEKIEKQILKLQTKREKMLAEIDAWTLKISRSTWDAQGPYKGIINVLEQYRQQLDKLKKAGETRDKRDKAWAAAQKKMAVLLGRVIRAEDEKTLNAKIRILEEVKMRTFIQNEELKNLYQELAAFQISRLMDVEEDTIAAAEARLTKEERGAEELKKLRIGIRKATANAILAIEKQLLDDIEGLGKEESVQTEEQIGRRIKIAKRALKLLGVSRVKIDKEANAKVRQELEASLKGDLERFQKNEATKIAEVKQKLADHKTTREKAADEIANIEETTARNVRQRLGDALITFQNFAIETGQNVEKVFKSLPMVLSALSPKTQEALKAWFDTIDVSGPIRDFIRRLLSEILAEIEAQTAAAQAGGGGAKKSAKRGAYISRAGQFKNLDVIPSLQDGGMLIRAHPGEVIAPLQKIPDLAKKMGVETKREVTMNVYTQFDKMELFREFKRFMDLDNFQRSGLGAST